MSRLFLYALLLIFGLATACNSTTGVNDDSLEDIAFFEGAESMEFETVFRTVDESPSGSYDFEESEEFVFNDAEEFSAFWSDIYESRTPTPEQPDIDFENKTVVAVVMGVQNTGGYSIEVQDVGVKEGVTGIRILETEPGSGCMTTDALTMPFHIIEFSNDLPDEYEFFSQREQIDCED